MAEKIKRMTGRQRIRRRIEEAEEVGERGDLERAIGKFRVLRTGVYGELNIEEELESFSKMIALEAKLKKEALDLMNDAESLRRSGESDPARVKAQKAFDIFVKIRDGGGAILARSLLVEIKTNKKAVNLEIEKKK